MKEQEIPTALIVEIRRTEQDAAKDLLTGAGWKVACSKTETEAFKLLEKTKHSPFVLVVSDFKLSRLSGDEFLKITEKISPLTRRMIIVPADDTEILIKAINNAHIHSCISFPFSRQDFLARVEDCHNDFLKILRQKQLVGMVDRQNRQLRLAAKNFKSKAKTGKSLITGKKTTVVLLKSKIQKQKRSEELPNAMTIETLVDHHDIPAKTEAFSDLFQLVCESARSTLLEIASRHGIEWKPTDIFPYIHQDINPSEVDCLAENIKKAAFIQTLKTNKLCPDKDRDQQSVLDLPDNYLSLNISEDHLTAWLEKKSPIDHRIVNLESILDYLRRHNVMYGIVNDNAIKEWLTEKKFQPDKIVIASGRAPIPPKDGCITYHFQTSYIKPGKILEDGSIDFKDRGEIPFVKKGSLLAKKTHPYHGADGNSVTGNKIPVNDPVDFPFFPGSGTCLSDDGLKIHADADGQPHADAMGCITVNEELLIKGDVNFEVGNVIFNGNIVVLGTIKPGFNIKGINLTAKAVESATIELTGDLNVSNGITDTTIHSVGHIHTKFINNCKILGFRDFFVEKEIIDSTILLSGSCQIPAGHIISSSVSAKNGIVAGQIGTVSSTPPDLRMGLDDHVDYLEKKASIALEKSMNTIAELRNKIIRLKERDTEYHRKIAELAFTREKLMLKIKHYRNRSQETVNKVFIQNLSDTLRKLEKETSNTNTEIINLFEAQDKLSFQMDSLTTEIQSHEKKNIGIMTQKKKFAQIRNQVVLDPEVSVRGVIVEGAKITGPNAGVTLPQDYSSCVIREERSDDDRSTIFMTISNR